MSNLIRLTAAGWATHDGPGMIAWLETLPASKERDWGVEEGFKRWLREDYDAAAKWIAGVETAAWSDHAHLVSSGRISNDDAQAGLDWAAKIQREFREQQLLLQAPHSKQQRRRTERERHAELAGQLDGQLAVTQRA